MQAVLHVPAEDLCALAELVRAAPLNAERPQEGFGQGLASHACASFFRRVEGLRLHESTSGAMQPSIGRKQQTCPLIKRNQLIARDKLSS